MPSLLKKPKSLVDCVGPSCQGCASMNCMASGGKVDHPKPSPDPDEDIFTDKSDEEPLPKDPPPGTIVVRRPWAKGGSVKSRHELRKSEKGVHKSITPNSGASRAGADVRAAHKLRTDNNNYESQEAEDYASHEEGLAKEKHRGVLGELKSMKKPNLYAHGGEVEAESPEDSQMDSDDGMEAELHSAVGEELLNAIERKDKKAILDSLEAIVMSCLSKGDM